MVALSTLRDLLEKALADRAGRREHLRRFEGLVWETEEFIGGDADTDEFLRDLAYELGYYEPDPVARAEYRSFYGDDRLEQLIRTALLTLLH